MHPAKRDDGEQRKGAGRDRSDDGPHSNDNRQIHRQSGRDQRQRREMTPTVHRQRPFGRQLRRSHGLVAGCRGVHGPEKRHDPLQDPGQERQQPAVQKDKTVSFAKIPGCVFSGQGFRGRTAAGPSDPGRVRIIKARKRP